MNKAKRKPIQLCRAMRLTTALLLAGPAVVYAAPKQENGAISNEEFEELLENGMLSLSNHDKETVRRLQDSGEDIGPYVYSKMATIIPDPLLSRNSDQKRQELEDKYGRWHFWDGEEEDRPSKSDYCADYDNRDIPGDFFPEDDDGESWQTDAVFVNHLLNDGEKLVERTLEALFTDVGRGKPLPPEGFMQRSEMFRVEQLDLTTQKPPTDYVHPTGKRLRGGWTTTRSEDGLIRRLLHAMMTNDEFVVVLGGDSAAAGHGNHFEQAYLMQFHRLVSPILARMGVKLVTRNLAMGHGLGTIQSSLGFSSLYGQEIDLLIWDSALTESQTAAYAELFFRQGLLSGRKQPHGGKPGKVPFLMVGPNSNANGLFDLLRMLHNEADIDVGQLGQALHSIPETTSAEQAETLPSAFQYVNCNTDTHALCNKNKHCTHCWLDREDVSDPKALFPHLSSDDNGTAADWWYPGWRQHQLMGRNLAYFVLDALQDAIIQFSAGTMGGPPLEDEEWHVTEMYTNMRNKLQTLFFADDDASTKNVQCEGFAKDNGLPPRICQVPMQGATEHTPRPDGTSLTSLIATTTDTDLVPVNAKTVQYEGHNVHNTCLDPGNVDIVQVASLRRRRLQWLSNGEQRNNWGDLDYMPPVFRQLHEARIAAQQQQLQQQRPPTRALLDGNSIELGKGWAIHGEKPGQCNGEYLTVCGRDSSDSCPLLGYHDSRGELVGSEACGWLVLNLPNVTHGIVTIKYSFYNTATTTSNRRQQQRQRGLRQQQEEKEQQRQLRAQRDLIIPDGDDFAFEFAIDGQATTSWTKQELLDHTKSIHKRVETTTLLDDAEFTSEPPKTVQLAIRVRGCDGSSCLFALSHVYWA